MTLFCFAVAEQKTIAASSLLNLRPSRSEIVSRCPHCSHRAPVPRCPSPAGGRRESTALLCPAQLSPAHRKSPGRHSGEALKALRGRGATVFHTGKKHFIHPSRSCGGRGAARLGLLRARRAPVPKSPADEAGMSTDPAVIHRSTEAVPRHSCHLLSLATAISWREFSFPLAEGNLKFPVDGGLRVRFCSPCRGLSLSPFTGGVRRHHCHCTHRALRVLLGTPRTLKGFPCAFCNFLYFSHLFLFLQETNFTLAQLPSPFLPGLLSYSGFTSLQLLLLFRGLLKWLLASSNCT